MVFSLNSRGDEIGSVERELLGAREERRVTTRSDQLGYGNADRQHLNNLAATALSRKV